MFNSIDMTGKTIVLTGATGVLGIAIANQFYVHGGNLVLVDRDKINLKSLSNKLGTHGRVCIVTICEIPICFSNITSCD